MTRNPIPLGRWRGNGRQGLRLCLILDVLRAADERPIPVSVIANALRTSERQTYRDLRVLGRAYPVCVEARTAWIGDET